MAVCIQSIPILKYNVYNLPSIYYLIMDGCEQPISKRIVLDLGRLYEKGVHLSAAI